MAQEQHLWLDTTRISRAVSASSMEQLHFTQFAAFSACLWNCFKKVILPIKLYNKKDLLLFDALHTNCTRGHPKCRYVKKNYLGQYVGHEKIGQKRSFFVNFQICFLQKKIKLEFFSHFFWKVGVIPNNIT